MGRSDNLQELERKIYALLPQQSGSQMRVEIIRGEAYYFISFDTLQTKGEPVAASVMEKLSRLFKRAQKKIEMPIYFLITREDISSLEIEIQNRINAIIRKQVANVWLSFASDNVADIFLVPEDDKTQFSQSELDTILTSIKVILSSKKFQCGSLQIKGRETVGATIPVVLRILRIKQPVDLQGLYLELQQRGFKTPQENWLENQLDKLRRNNLLVFDKSTKRYLLTLQGINALSNQGGRNSVDVVHALELSQRRW